MEAAGGGRAAETGPIGVTGHRLVAAADGRNDVYLLGGWSPEVDDGTEHFDTKYVRTVWHYNVSTRLWTRLVAGPPRAPPADMDKFVDGQPLAFASHCAVALDRRRLLVVGGSLSPLGIPGCSSAVYLFDLVDRRWSLQPCTGAVPDLERCGHWFGASAAFDPASGVLYVVNGRVAGAPGESAAEPSAHGLCELHALDTRSWHWRALSRNDCAAPAARIRAECVVYDGKLYVLGGSCDRFDAHYARDGLVRPFVFDLDAGVWDRVSTLPDAKWDRFPSSERFAFTAVLAAAGRVFVSSGLGYARPGLAGDRPEVNNSVWMLDLRSLQWHLYSSVRLRTWFDAGCVAHGVGESYHFGGCAGGPHAYSSAGARSTMVRRLRVDPAPLAECAWRVLCNHMPSFAGRRLRESDTYYSGLLHIGVPERFARRLLHPERTAPQREHVLVYRQ